MRFRFFLCGLALVAALSPGCGRGSPPAGAPDLADKEADCPGGGYDTLAAGGSMYVGEVTAVTVTRSVPADAGDPPYYEAGVVRFRVSGTVFGPRRKEVDVGYDWMDDDPDRVILGSDWSCNAGPWKQRPRAGDRLLLVNRKE